MNAPRMFLNDRRDIPILLFLWQWKIATTATIGARFFSGCAAVTAYNRMWQMKRAGFVEQCADTLAQKFAWTLSARAFRGIRDALPELREEGFKSENVQHDLIVNALHIGEWLVKTPEGVELFTEQQLRRYDREFYPGWVPTSDTHRPDGYWRISRGTEKRTIAIEVELSRRTEQRYGDQADFYNSSKQVDGVLWIVTTRSATRRIQSRVSRGFSPRVDIHQFVRLDDFLTHGWQAPIDAGNEQGKSIHEYLTGCSSFLANGNECNSKLNHSCSEAEAELLQRSRYVLAQLDGRKRPAKLVGSPQMDAHDKAELSTQNPSKNDTPTTQEPLNPGEKPL